MKHPSKQYRLAEKECIRLASRFRKMVEIDKRRNRPVHHEVEDFIGKLNNVIRSIETHVEHRIEKQEKDEALQRKMRENVKTECPVCNKILRVTVTGEVKAPSTGFTHYRVKCKTCGNEFMNKIPVSDKEALQWCKNLFAVLTKRERDGQYMWQRMGIPEKNIDDLERKLYDYRVAVEEENRALAEQRAAQGRIDKLVADTRDKLLLLRLKQQNWSAGDAKA